MRKYNKKEEIIPLENQKIYSISPNQVLVVKERTGYVPYFQLFYNHELIIKLDSLVRSTRRVYYCLLEMRAEENKVEIDFKRVALRVNISIKSTYKALEELKKAQLIMKVEGHEYRLNPYLSWKGSQKNLSESLEEWKNLIASSKVSENSL